MKNTVEKYVQVAKDFAELYSNGDYELDGVGKVFGKPYIQIHTLTQLRALFPDAEIKKEARKGDRPGYDFEFSIIVDGVEFLSIHDDTLEH